MHSFKEKALQEKCLSKGHKGGSLYRGTFFYFLNTVEDKFTILRRKSIQQSASGDEHPGYKSPQKTYSVEPAAQFPYRASTPEN